jgi:hypothetical protein
MTEVEFTDADFAKLQKLPFRVQDLPDDKDDDL